MKWAEGRQGGYVKAKLFSWRVCDCYLICYRAGSELPMHRDPVEHKQHYRFNILLFGEDAFVGAFIWKWWRFTYFRSDEIHGTTLLTRPRMILSFGWVR